MQPVVSQDDLGVLRQVHGPEGDGLNMSSNDQTHFNLSINTVQDGAVCYDDTLFSPSFSYLISYLSLLYLIFCITWSRDFLIQGLGHVV